MFCHNCDPDLVKLWSWQSVQTHFYPNIFFFFLNYIFISWWLWKRVRPCSFSTINNPLYHNTVHNCTSMYISLKSLTLALIFYQGPDTVKHLCSIAGLPSQLQCVQINFYSPVRPYPKTFSSSHHSKSLIIHPRLMPGSHPWHPQHPGPKLTNDIFTACESLIIYSLGNQNITS